MSVSEHISPLLGRWIMAWFFLSEAWWRLNDWDGTVTLMRLKHVPDATPLLALALVVMVLGGLSLVLGYHTRQGALLLFAFTIIVSVAMHDYWKIDNAVDREADYDLFIRNLAIAGGLLYLVGMGPGPFALDNPGRKRR